MDTTSHNFSWQSWTFGEHSSSVLYDVAIINENDIWAVGEIYMNDSLGNPDPNAYNAVHWDGTEWELKKITVYFRGSLITPPLTGVFTLSSTDIWFVGSLPIHGDGISWQMFDLRTTVDPTISLSKAWGISSEDIYFVGLAGNIAHYENGVWTKIESGTDLNINDIWGDYNNKTGAWEILAVAANVNTSVERSIIKIDNNSAQIISSKPIEWSLRSIWFAAARHYYAAGSGIYEKHYLSDTDWNNMPLDITTYYTNRIRGNSINDVIGVGAFGDVTHFNGCEWKNDYNEPRLSFGSYFSVDIKNDIVAAVGLEFNQAVILKGIR